MSMMKRKNGASPREGQKCNRCGSSDSYCTPGKCPAQDETCRYCKEVGHNIHMCSKLMNKKAAQQRYEENRNAHKRPSENSSEASSKRPKKDPSINPTPLVLIPEAEKIYDCLIGNRPSRFKIGKTNPVNIISQWEYMKLVASESHLKTNDVLQLQHGSNMTFNGVFAARLKLSNVNSQYVNFFICEGADEFVLITKELAEKLDIKHNNIIQFDSSSSSESDSKHERSSKPSKPRRDDGEGAKRSEQDNPSNQAQISSRHNKIEKHRERQRPRDKEPRNTSSCRDQRDDDRKNDSNRARQSADSSQDDRKRSLQERRCFDDTRDNRDGERSDDRDNDPFDNRLGSGVKQRRLNDRQGDNGNYEGGRRDINQDPGKATVENDKRKFGPLFGKLTEEGNTVHELVVKFAEAPEAKIPKLQWRLYPFMNETALPSICIHGTSAFLIGRDRKICDIVVDHPSCSKQHAALHYRLVPYEREDGSTGKRVRPYIIDLESANGTFVNRKKIDPNKYVELLEKDVIKFGFSSKVYVLLHDAEDEAVDDAEDDDPPPAAAAAAADN